jgi:hypothetical protein
MPSREIQNVLNIRLTADRESRRLEASNTKLQLVRRHDHVGPMPQVIGEFTDGYKPLGLRCLELSVAAKHNDRLHCLRWDEIQETAYCTDVAPVRRSVTHVCGYAV